MKEKVLFYASQTQNLKEIKKGEKVYTKLSNCILKNAYNICSGKGIDPKSGIEYEPETGKSTYVLIERYNGQFAQLNCNLSIYAISLKNNNIDKDYLLTNDASILNEVKISDLYEYLQMMKNVELVSDDYYNKYAYDTPFDNRDIIKEYFIKIIKEQDNKKRVKLIKNIQVLLPDQDKIIKKIYKLISKMDTEDALIFINSIFTKKENSLDYSLIKKENDKHSLKNKIKSLFI